MPAIESIVCGGTIVNYVDGSTEWLRDGKVVMYKTPDGAYKKYHDESSPIDYEVASNIGISIYYRNGAIKIYDNQGDLLKEIDPTVVPVQKPTWTQIVTGK